MNILDIISEGTLKEYGDTAKGQKMLTKVQKRAVDRVTSKKADTDPAYAKKNSDTANRAWDRMTDKDVEEAGYGRNRGYSHGFADPNAPQLGRHHRDMDDEANLLYIYKDGRVKQRMVGNHEERAARAEGFRDTPEQALRIHNIIRSKFDPNKWVQKQGMKWVQVHPFGAPTTESATAGATSAANIGTVDAPHISPGKARGKKSYIGNPWGGQSGTKAPPQPKIVQPKNKDGTAKNGLDSSNLLGGGAIKR